MTCPKLLEYTYVSQTFSDLENDILKLNDYSSYFQMYEPCLKDRKKDGVASATKAL